LFRSLKYLNLLESSFSDR